jgi:hypothetical protein
VSVRGHSRRFRREVGIPLHLNERTYTAVFGSPESCQERSFDHFLGAAEQWQWHCECRAPGGFVANANFSSMLVGT